MECSTYGQKAFDVQFDFHHFGVFGKRVAGCKRMGRRPFLNSATVRGLPRFSRVSLRGPDAFLWLPQEILPAAAHKGVVCKIDSSGDTPVTKTL